MRLIVIVLAATLAGCAALERPDPSAPPTVIEGTLKSVSGRPLSGLVLFEKGELHGNVWDRGGLVEDGRFRIQMARGGQYGLHVYASGYFYRPQAVMVETGQTLTLDLLLAPQPTRDPDPVIKQVGFFPSEERPGRVTYVKMDAADPDDNLGPQVMAFNAATGQAYAMIPSEPVEDLKANFPQGVYQIAVDGSKAPINPRDWYFVVADHACWTSDILAYPHQPRPHRVVTN